ADFKDIETRTDYENWINWYFHINGVNGFKSMNVFPPLQEYTDSEYVAGIHAVGFDAILVVSPNGVTKGSSTEYNPLLGSYETSSHVDGIFTEVSMTDVRTGKKVYRASLSTGIGRLSGSGMSSIAGSIYDDLSENGYLMPTIAKQE